MANDSTTPDPLVVELQYVLVEALKLNIDPRSLSDSAPLADLQAGDDERTYQVDSVDMVEFIVAVENSLGVDLLEEDGVAEVDSLAQLATLLRGRVGQAALDSFCERGRARRSTAAC